MAKKNWIAGAIKHPGSFTRQAKKAGKSVGAYASEVSSDPSGFSPRTVKRASLARTLRGMNKRGRR